MEKIQRKRFSEKYLQIKIYRMREKRSYKKEIERGESKGRTTETENDILMIIIINILVHGWNWMKKSSLDLIHYIIMDKTPFFLSISTMTQYVYNYNYIQV